MQRITPRRRGSSLTVAHRVVDEGVIQLNEVTETVRPVEHADQVPVALQGIGASLDSRQEAHTRSEMDDDE